MYMYEKRNVFIFATNVVEMLFHDDLFQSNATGVSHDIVS